MKNEPFLPFLLAELAANVSVPYEVIVQTEKGLGYAVMCGVKRARGDVLVICDSDGSHPVSAINKMVKLASQYPIVVASRYSGGATHDILSRELISRAYCLLTQLLFGLSVRDNMSGFIAVQKSVLAEYPIGVSGFKWGTELLIKVRKSKLKAVEYPIVFEQRKMGKSKASPLEAIHTLVFLVRLRMQV